MYQKRAGKWFEGICFDGGQNGPGNLKQSLNTLLFTEGNDNVSEETASDKTILSHIKILLFIFFPKCTFFGGALYNRIVATFRDSEKVQKEQRKYTIHMDF